jgi:glucose/arabinose dehydrogenase
MQRLLASLLLTLATPAVAASLPLSKVHLPQGFKIEVLAEVPGARSLAIGQQGTVFVGTRDENVYAVKDGKVYPLAKGLTSPNGVAFRDGNLYVAEISRVSVLKDIESHLSQPPKPEPLSATFPSEAHHGWKFIAFGPDGKLYVPVGAPCNVCDKGDDYAAIFRIAADGTQKELVAKGIRNTVGFDWHPEAKRLYFTDNGRDLLGEDVPSDELNVAPKLGLDFGFPRCHAGSVPDPEFGKGKDACKGSEKPVALFGAHVAALGMRFYNASQFPAAYHHRIFVAEHGSWNRSQPDGYRVVTVKLDSNGKQGKVETFATGWLEKDGSAWGRPVDVQVQPDGSLLVSDDKAGVIYKITYVGG